MPDPRFAPYPTKAVSWLRKNLAAPPDRPGQASVSVLRSDLVEVLDYIDSPHPPGAPEPAGEIVAALLRLVTALESHGHLYTALGDVVAPRVRTAMRRARDALANIAKEARKMERKP